MEIKKHLSFLFICITTYILPANAQKLVSTNNLWAYLNRNPFTGEDITTYYKLGADTTLGVNTFKKLFYCNDSLQNQWYYSGTALREDTTAKVYYYNFSSSQELLLYNFNLLNLDTFYSFCHVPQQTSYDTIRYAVNRVDSVLMNNGDYWRSFELDIYSAYFPGQSLGSEKWLTGIGSLTSLLDYNGTPCYPFADPGISSLLCFSRNDTVIYADPNYNTCYKNTVGVSKNSKKSFFNVIPNPNNGNFYINFEKQFKSIEITLTDLLGCVILKQSVIGQKIQMQLESADKGIYLLIAKADNQMFETKIVIQ